MFDLSKSLKVKVGIIRKLTNDFLSMINGNYMYIVFAFLQYIPRYSHLLEAA